MLQLYELQGEQLRGVEGVRGKGSRLGCSRSPWSSWGQSSFVQVVTEEQEEVH